MISKTKVLINSKVEESVTSAWMAFHAKASSSHQDQAYFNDMLTSLLFQLVFHGPKTISIMKVMSLLNTMWNSSRVLEKKRTVLVSLARMLKEKESDTINPTSNLALSSQEATSRLKETSEKTIHMHSTWVLKILTSGTLSKRKSIRMVATSLSGNLTRPEMLKSKKHL